MKKLCGLLLLLTASMMASAAIDNGVDENGSTNYGQKISEQYQNMSESMNTKISVSDATPVNQKRNASPDKKNTSCSAKEAEYQKSLSCFRGCSTPTASGGRNISSCKCKNVSKPSC